MPRALTLALATLFLPGFTALAAPSPAAEGDPFSPAMLPRTGPKPPWPRRRRATEKPKPSAQGLLDLARWPAEPDAPASVEEVRFAAALKQLCGGWWPPRRPLLWARMILEHARAFGVDPFLVAATIYRQSRCLPNEKPEDGFGIGLGKIDPKMHAPFLRKGRYRYFVLEGNAWKPRELELGKFSLLNLRRAEPSIYFTAGLLAVAKRQCPGTDAAFGSVPHRHFVSHFIWGDRVRGAGAEDRVLQARRSLLEHYAGKPLEPRGRYKELALRLPLDGAPRVVTSTMGADRDDGKRFHKGIDFASTWGEPVRAVADGRVVLAGIDRPAGGPINVEPEEASTIKSSQLGPGGLFVMVLHEGGLRSAYMHLSSYVVKANQRVKSGDLLGHVGKTGTRESGAHLHFELRAEGKHLDPMPCFAAYVIGPEETWLGRKLVVEENRVRRVRRIKRWRERQEQHPGSPSPSTKKQSKP
jgi:hypothetical protein